METRSLLRLGRRKAQLMIFIFDTDQELGPILVEKPRILARQLESTPLAPCRPTFLRRITAGSD